MTNRLKRFQLLGGINIADNAPKIIRPKSITVRSNDTIFDFNKSYQLYADVQPDNASQEVTWHSSDSTIAIVDDSGLVTCLAGGYVTIIAKSLYFPDMQGSIDLRVRPIPTAINIIDNSIDGAVIMNRGATHQIEWELVPKDANPNVTFSVNNTYATVDGNGLITMSDAVPQNQHTSFTAKVISVFDDTIVGTSPYKLYQSPTLVSMSFGVSADFTVNTENNQIGLTTSPSFAPTTSDITFSDDAVASITSIEPQGYTQYAVITYFKTNEVGRFFAKATNIYYPTISATSPIYYVHPQPTGYSVETSIFNIVMNDGLTGNEPKVYLQPYNISNPREQNAIQGNNHTTTTPDILTSTYVNGLSSKIYKAVNIGEGKLKYTSKIYPDITTEVTVNVVPLVSFDIVARSKNNISSNLDEYVYKMDQYTKFPLVLYPFDIKANGSDLFNPNHDIYTISFNTDKIILQANNATCINVLEPIENEIVRITNNDQPEFYGEIKVTVIPYGS